MKRTTRKLFIGGNWKCNNTLSDTRTLTTSILNPLKFNPNKLDILITPAAIHIHEVSSILTEKSILLGAQHVSKHGFGAYTGELSVKHLADYKVGWTLAGHSERRTLYGETVKEVAEKTSFALENGIKVVLCMGETLEERDTEQTLDVILENLTTVDGALKDKQMWNNIVISYEPVWAIGTGKVASPQQAQHVHKFIRRWILENLGKDYAHNIRIVYGGSVTDKNCKPLLIQEDIDGFLLGGASLLPAFKEIVRIAQEMV